MEMNDGFIRIVEFLHALKIFIEAADGLREADLEALQEIKKIMEGEN